MMKRHVWMGWKRVVILEGCEERCDFHIYTGNLHQFSE